MPSTEDQTLYDEWKGFLQSDREDLRLAAVSAVLQHEHPLECVRQGMVPILAKLSGNLMPALKALVFLAADGPASNQCVLELQEAGGIPRMLELVLQPPPPSTANNTNAATAAAHKKLWQQTVNYAMALLANLTRTEAGALDLVGKTLPDEAVFHTSTNHATNSIPEDSAVEHTDDSKPTTRNRNHKMDLLLARFLHISYQCNDDDSTATAADTASASYTDPYQHFASVLMNATQTTAGRQYLLFQQQQSDGTSTTILQRLLPNLRSANPVRRQGLAGTLRNICCTERDEAYWLLNTVKIHNQLLYPLAGPEELEVDEKQGLDPELWLEGPDKVREPDGTTRLWLVEAILLLCATGRASREVLRLARTYVILKWADMVEEREDVSERIVEIVNFLRRDEAGTAEGSSDQMVADAYRKLSSRVVEYANQDFDAVD